MKTRNLFAIKVLQLVSAVLTVFLFQGCFPCLTCNYVVKKRPDSQLNYVMKEQIQQRAQAETVVVTESGRTTQGIDHQLQGIVENTSSIPAADLVVPAADISPVSLLLPKVIADNIHTVENTSRISRFMPDDVVNRAIPAAGKNCPLGIRSIESHIIAGPNISFKSSKEGDDVYGNNGHKHEPGIGFQVGMGSKVAFTEKFSVNTALLLKQNNASEKISYGYTDPGYPGSPGGSGGETKDKYSYTYLSAPVVASYQVGKQAEVFAGPEVNYLLKSSVKREGGTGGGDKENITKSSVKLGVGVQAGIKYRFPSGEGDSPFGVQLLYEHRLSRLNKKNPDGYSTYDVPAWNMKGFQVGVTCSVCELMKGKR